MTPVDTNNRMAHDKQQLLLGNAAMDQTHREFLDLHAQLLKARGPAFATGFSALLAHTREHFASEEQLMAQTGFPATAEHQADHQRVLGEMDRFAQRIAAGSTMLAKAWAKEQLPGWFDVHVRSMDSALAAHLNKTVTGVTT